MGFTALLDEQNRDVGRKLGIATGMMFTMPLLTYFVAFHLVFSHKAEPSNWAGGAAIVVTNLIIFAYVYVAFNEPDDDDDTLKRGNAAHDNNNNDNDVRHPRTGIFKKRVD